MKWDEVGREGRDTCAEWRPSSVHVRDSPGPHEGPGESVTRGEQTDCKRKDEWDQGLADHGKDLGFVTAVGSH